MHTLYFSEFKNRINDLTKHGKPWPDISPWNDIQLNLNAIAGNPASVISEFDTLVKKGNLPRRWSIDLPAVNLNQDQFQALLKALEGLEEKDSVIYEFKFDSQGNNVTARGISSLVNWLLGFTKVLNIEIVKENPDTKFGEEDQIGQYCERNRILNEFREYRDLILQKCSDASLYRALPNQPSSLKYLAGSLLVTHLAQRASPEDLPLPNALKKYLESLDRVTKLSPSQKHT